jgi:hypothetical protein
MGAKEMEAVLVDIEHKEFLQEQKTKPPGERVKWDKTMAHKYPVEEGKKYCLGWSFAPCTTIQTLDKCIPVSLQVHSCELESSQECTCLRSGLSCKERRTTQYYESINHLQYPISAERRFATSTNACLEIGS